MVHPLCDVLACVLAEVFLYSVVLVQVDIKGASELSESESNLSNYKVWSSVLPMVVVSLRRYRLPAETGQLPVYE